MVHKRRGLNSNYLIANFAATSNIAMRRRLRSVKIVRTSVAIRLLRILYREGVIRTFAIDQFNDYISVYFKYTDGVNLCSRLTIVSKPSKRGYWGLNELARVYNNHNFTGFYIISTPKGFVTSSYCLLEGHSGGEALLKVELS